MFEKLHHTGSELLTTVATGLFGQNVISKLIPLELEAASEMFRASIMTWKSKDSVSSCHSEKLWLYFVFGELR